MWTHGEVNEEEGDAQEGREKRKREQKSSAKYSKNVVGTVDSLLAKWEENVSHTRMKSAAVYLVGCR